MTTNTNQQRIVRYYSSLESWVGYNVVLWGAKHFGYYPTGRKGTTEREAQLFLQDLVAEKLALTSNDVVLDAGCGQGVVSTYLAKKFGSTIYGITLVPFEVTSAQALAKSVGVADTTKYAVMDYSTTTFPDGFFDAIYTTETLSHSPDIRATLRELYRVLKPGGRVAFFEYTLAPDAQFSEWETKMLNLVISGSAMMGLKEFRHDRFPDVLGSVGFEGVEEQNITNNIKPSFRRLHMYAQKPYRIIRFFGLQKYFVNATAGYEYYKMMEKGLFRYCIFTARKPIETRH